MKNLKDSIGEHVDLEGQPYDPREQFSAMDSDTLLHNFVINSW